VPEKKHQEPETPAPETQPEQLLPRMIAAARRRRSRAIDEAWEAAVRDELTRIRSGHARDRRFMRPGEILHPRDRNRHEDRA
jgi:hypothetical protein